MDTIIKSERNTDSHRTRRWEDLTYVALGMWTLGGLGLDGYYHRYNPELESFWTPWHAVFYAGFTASAAFLAWTIIKLRPKSPSLRESIPRGYELAVVGLGLFALGGIGDAIWHTVFGIETSIDALLSPTHLVLFIGSMLGTTAPIRAAWGDQTGRRLGWSAMFPVTVALAVTATAVAFFFQYANGFNHWPLTDVFDPEANGDQLRAGFGVLMTLASTVILLGAAFLLLRRWQPPFGTFTLMFGIVGFFMAGLDGFRYPWQMLAPIIGGLTADFLIAKAPGRHRLLGAMVPLVMWSTSTAAIHLAWEVRWPPELWVGQIVMASITGVGLSLLVFPPAVPIGPFDASGQPEESASNKEKAPSLSR